MARWLQAWRGLRTAEEKAERQSLSGTHATPLPHIRRAHWHSFWKGPRTIPVKRYLVVHWFPLFQWASRILMNFLPQNKTNGVNSISKVSAPILKLKIIQSCPVTSLSRLVCILACDG
ncbi:MAG: hypothetical protein ACLQO6_12835 [Desulfomonilaceae bacterium]